MTAIVLAGGRSSRMGRPKALLPFDGEPLILHIVRRLQRLFPRIVVVASPGQELPEMPVTIVHDEVAYQGPVGGLYYGLKATEDEAAFVTSCDSAFASDALISHLVASIPGYDVVVPRWDGRLQPLLAVYRHSVLPHLERQAHAQIQTIRARSPTASTENVFKAHAVWELRRTVLAEAEKRVVERLDVYARSGESFPTDELQKLKDARAECSSAFDQLMAALDEAACSIQELGGS